jgi:hypothetical protein
MYFSKRDSACFLITCNTDLFFGSDFRSNSLVPGLETGYILVEPSGVACILQVLFPL